MAKKQKTGQVVKDKMIKSVVVEINILRNHPIYSKKYRVTNKFICHDENNEYKVGDNVIIEECKPYSKRKAWKVLKKLS